MDKINTLKYGREIASVRAYLHITQSELAKRIGVTNITVSNWERGIKIPPVDKFDEIMAMRDK
jgi:transcriptional regulator with XRE-family HTH domain